MYCDFCLNFPAIYRQLKVSFSCNGQYYALVLWSTVVYKGHLGALLLHQTSGMYQIGQEETFNMESE